MNALDALKLILIVVGVIVSIPILVIVVRVAFFFGGLKRSVDALEKAAGKFGDKVDRILDELCTDVGELRARVSVLEDARERKLVDTPHGQILGRRAGDFEDEGEGAEDL
jgi:hypothetical protein